MTIKTATREHVGMVHTASQRFEFRGVMTGFAHVIGVRVRRDLANRNRPIVATHAARQNVHFTVTELQDRLPLCRCLVVTGFAQVAGVEVFMPAALTANVGIGTGMAALAVRGESRVVNVRWHPASNHVTGIAGLYRGNMRGRVLTFHRQLAGAIVTRRTCDQCLCVIKSSCRFPTPRKFVVAELTLNASRQPDIVLSCNAAGFQSVVA